MGKKKGSAAVPDFLKVQDGGASGDQPKAPGVVNIGGENITMLAHLQVFLGVNERGEQWASVVGQQGSESGVPVALPMKACMVLLGNYFTHFIKNLEFYDDPTDGLDIPKPGIQIPNAPGQS